MATKATLTRNHKTLTVDGAKYHVRYVYEHETKGTLLVCDTNKLRGAYGDEFPLAEVEGTFKVKPAP